MKKSNSGAIFFNALIILFIAVICIYALDYKPRVRLVPLLVGIVSLVISILVLINELYPLPVFGKIELDLMSPLEEKEGENEQQAIPSKMLAIIFWMIGFMGLTLLVGFYISIAVFCFAFLKFQEKVGWLKSICVTAGVWAFVYLVFTVVMELQMFEGVLFGAILQKI